jgi:hypothetical protein
MQTLKQDALAYFSRAIRGQGLGRMTREKGVWLGYVVLSAASIALFLAFNVWLISTATA